MHLDFFETVWRVEREGTSVSLHTQKEIDPVVATVGATDAASPCAGCAGYRNGRACRPRASSSPEMDLPFLTPALERLWIDEVLHLHALWHRGPPRSHNSNAPTSSSSINPDLRPTSSTAFKREKRRKRKEQKMQQKRQQQSLSAAPDRTEPSNPPASDIEWPCAATPAPHSDDAGWGGVAPKPATTRPPASAEERARAAALLVQRNAISACLKFFKTVDSDDEDDDAMDADGDEEELRVFKFFLGLFEKDEELRAYYEKRFTSCIGLVQHSNSISKTKRREAHRAFGRAMCQVLGWDINRLPCIVLSMGEHLGQSLAKATSPKGDVQKEGSPSHAEKNPEKVPENLGTTEGEDLIDGVETREEALPQSDVQKEGSCGRAEKVAENLGTEGEDLMDRDETREEDFPQAMADQQENHQIEVVDLVDSDA